MNTKRLFNQMGFSLIETLVGVAILSILGLVVIRAIDSNNNSRVILEEKTQAANIITAYLEGVRQLTFSDETDPYSSIQDNIVLPPQYVLDINITYSPDGEAWYSTSNNGAYKLQKINIVVLRESGKPILSGCTFKTTRVTQ
jgi:prepilin-type N-terminal cleavage/methylation domain-containing protein